MPNHRSPHASVAAGALLLLTSGLAGCALHWPWHHRAPSAPAPVHVLGVVGPGGGAAPQIAQSWDRNTLLLDLTAAGAEGGATLSPPASGWPVRLAFRVQPGGPATLQVSGAQNQTFIVPAQGVALVLKLAPSVYEPTTPSLTLRWSAAGDSAR